MITELQINVNHQILCHSKLTSSSCTDDLKKNHSRSSKCCNLKYIYNLYRKDVWTRTDERIEKKKRMNM